MKLSVCIILLAWSAQLIAASSELDAARNALRDQLWTIADTNAATAELRAKDDPSTRRTARLVQLEALAGASRTSDMLARLKTWKDDTNEFFRYWRGWAYAHSGHADEARAELKPGFSTPELRMRALRLAAWTAFAAGDMKSAEAGFRAVAQACTNDPATRAENACDWAHALAAGGGVTNALSALSVLEHEGATRIAGEQGDLARLEAAQLYELAGQTGNAGKLYRQLVDGGTNTCAAAFVPAACELSETLLAVGTTNDAVRVASNAVARALRLDHRLRAGMALGFALLADPATRRAGREQIVRLVGEFPGESASESAQRRLADSLLAWGDGQAAGEEYARLVKAFPSAESDEHVLEGQAWAAMRLGLQDEALAKFERAARVAQEKTNVVVLARCLFKKGDLLMAGGHFKEASEVYGKIEDKALVERALFHCADALERAGCKTEAEEKFRMLFGRGGPYAVEAGLRAADLEASFGHLENAVSVYGRLLDERAARHPTREQRVRVLSGRGRALYRAYRFREAEADFAAAAKLDDASADRMKFWCVLCRYGDGRDRQAIDGARALLKTAADPALVCDLTMWIAKYDAAHRSWERAAAGFVDCATNGQNSAVTRIECLVRAARCVTELADFPRVVQLIGCVETNAVELGAAAKQPPTSSWLAEGLTLKGEAFIELGRFDEALKSFVRVRSIPASAAARRRAELAYADCLLAGGADDSSRYDAALKAYDALWQEKDLPASLRLRVAFMTARTLEKLRRTDEAINKYYVDVVRAYWEAVRPDAREENRVWFDGDARALFVRAVFVLADYYETRGECSQAVNVLKYLDLAGVKEHGVKGRIERLRRKGGF